MTRKEFEDLDKLFARLLDCDLSAWDQDFTDDMVRRLARYGQGTWISGKQWAQIERMKGQYL